MVLPQIHVNDSKSVKSSSTFRAMSPTSATAKKMSSTQQSETDDQKQRHQPSNRTEETIHSCSSTLKRRRSSAIDDSPAESIAVKRDTVANINLPIIHGSPCTSPTRKKQISYDPKASKKLSPSSTRSKLSKSSKRSSSPASSAAAESDQDSIGGSGRNFCGGISGACQFCGIRKTGQWRRGPAGQRTLCNACGINWTKKVKAEAARSGVSLHEAEKIVGDDSSKFRKSLYIQKESPSKSLSKVAVSKSSAGLVSKKKKHTLVTPPPSLEMSALEQTAEIQTKDLLATATLPYNADSGVKHDSQFTIGDIDPSNMLVAAAAAVEAAFTAAMEEAM
jgi:hypothetical protein